MIVALLAIAIIEIAGLRAPARLIQSALHHQPSNQTTIATSKTTSALPVPKGELPDPGLGAAAVYVVDATTGTVLYAKNADTPRPIASLTKMMTMLAILKSHDPNEVVTIPQLGPYKPDDAVGGFLPGEQFSLRDLAAAALIPSYNDAADALAIHDSETKEKFYGKMNSIAAEWGISGATFASASGLEDSGNMATAHGLATVARLGLTNQLFKQLTSTKTMTIRNLAGKTYVLGTTNELLGNGSVYGVKTGFTPAAGQSFVALAKVQGHDIITVMLASPNRFGETTKLIDWVNTNYTWQTTN